jgi:acyl carrier protein
MIKAVTEIIKEILEDNGEKLTIEVTKQTQLRDLGLTSFDLATLTVKIEDEFDVDIFEDGIVSTIGEIIEVLEATS